MKRKKQTRSLAPVLLIVAGAGIFLYPILSNWYMQQQQEAAITSYEMDVAQRDDVEELWEQARTYNENLSGDPVHDPFVVGSGYVLPDDYGQVLNLTEDGIMGHVVIEKIKVDLPIYHGTGEDVLKKGTAISREAHCRSEERTASPSYVRTEAFPVRNCSQG